MAAGPAPSEAIGDDADPEDASSAEVRRRRLPHLLKTQANNLGTHSMFPTCFEHAMQWQQTPWRLRVDRLQAAMTQVSKIAIDWTQDGGSGHSPGARRGAPRRRMMWTPELHDRFLNAVNHLVIMLPQREDPLVTWCKEHCC